MEIELDSWVIIEQVNGRKPYWRIRVNIVNITTFADQVEQITWKTISRTVNKCDDWIAKQARKGESLNDWVSRPPLPLIILLAKDYSVERSWCFITTLFGEII